MGMASRTSSMYKIDYDKFKATVYRSNFERGLDSRGKKTVIQTNEPLKFKLFSVDGQILHQKYCKTPGNMSKQIKVAKELIKYQSKLL